MPHFLKKTRQLIEGAFVWACFIIIRIVPFNLSVALWGWIGRKVGPLMPWNKWARLNIHKCFPELSSHEIEEIIKEMWDNHGRLIAEYTNAAAFWDGKNLRNIEVRGIENLKHFQKDGKPGVIFTGHLGNWQMITLAAQSIGFDMTQMSRATNNPWVDRIMLRCLKLAVKDVIRKRGGSRGLLSLLKRGEHAFLMVDQKMGEGISVPFLGHDAMTAKGIAWLYLKQNCPLLPARCERLHGSHFRVTFYPPIEYTPCGDQQQDMYNLLLQVNTMIGEWIKERPAQWLWIHRRWGL